MCFGHNIRVRLRMWGTEVSFTFCRVAEALRCLLNEGLFGVSELALV